MNQICANCDGEMEETLIHNCVRGITDNINQLRNAIAYSIEKKIDHLDGLKYALEVIEQMELHYKHLGINYEKEQFNPFHDLHNRIRMLLGLKLIQR